MAYLYLTLSVFLNASASILGKMHNMGIDVGSISKKHTSHSMTECFYDYKTAVAVCGLAEMIPGINTEVFEIKL